MDNQDQPTGRARGTSQAVERVQNPYREGGDIQLGPQLTGGAGENALVGREVAEAQSAMILARKFPRNPVQASDKILNECQRLSLATKAQYAYARGGSEISGPSIRLAETIARHWGNLDTGFAEVARRQGFSECVAVAVDLETGYRVQKRFIVKHWRDRKNGGGYELTDERDIYEVIANNAQRRVRACILSVIPGDVVERAIDQCNLTLRTKADVTPERIKSMVEKFAAYGVTPAMIDKRLQRRHDTMLPAQLVSLGRIYTSLEDEMSVPAEWFDMALAVDQTQPETPPKGTDKLDAMAEKPAAQTATTEQKPAAETTATKATKTTKAKPAETKSAETKPTETVEVGPSGGELMAQILKATNVEIVNEALDLARSLKDGERQMVEQAGKMRTDQLAKPADTKSEPNKPAAARGLFTEE